MRKLTKFGTATMLALAALAFAAPAWAADGVVRPDDRPNHGAGWIVADGDRGVRPTIA